MGKKLHFPVIKRATDLFSVNGRGRGKEEKKCEKECRRGSEKSEKSWSESMSEGNWISSGMEKKETLNGDRSRQDRWNRGDDWICSGVINISQESREQEQEQERHETASVHVGERRKGRGVREGNWI